MTSPVEILFRLSGLGAVVSGLGAIGNGLDQISQKATNAGRALRDTGRAMQSFGTGMAASVTAPLAAATAGLIHMAAEAVESENLFEVSMGGMADAAREFSDQLSSSLGLNAYELRRQIGVMQNFTTAMGVSEDSAYSLSTGVAQLSGDMASFFNISNEEAFRRIQSGLAGEIEPLRRLGIVVNDAAVQAQAAAMGLTGELTDQQKVLIRYNLILAQTSNAQGDLARTINSPANAMRVLGAQFQQLGIDLGTALLPTIQAVVLAIRDNVVPVLQGWIAAFQALEPRQRGFIVLAGLAVAAIGPLIAIIGVLVGLFGTLLVIIGALLSPIGLIIAGLALLAAGVYFARDSVADLIAAFEVLTGASVTNIVNTVRRIGESAMRFIGGAFEVAGDIFMTVVRNIGIGLATILDGVADAARFMGQDGLAGSVQAAADAVRSLSSGELIDSTGRLAQAGEHLGSAWESFASNVSEAGDTVVGATQGMADFLGGASEEMTDANEAVAMSYEAIGNEALETAGQVAAASEAMMDAAKEAQKVFDPSAMSGLNMLGGDDTRTAADVFKEWSDELTNFGALAVETAEGVKKSFDGFINSFSSGVGDAFGKAIVYGENLGKALQDVAKKALAQLIGALVQLGVQFVINAALGQALAGSAAAAAQVFGRATAAAWANAAALVSLATFGANAAPAAAGIASVVGMAQGLAKFARGTDSFTATGPRLMLVGENGPERVSVTPLGAGAGGGQSSVNIFIPEGAIFDEISFERVAERIGDAVIQRMQRGTV